MKTFSFVIPTYNHYPLLHQTLYDIYQRCSPVHEVIVVDDGSTDEDYVNGLKWWKSNGMLPVRHVRMSQNSGFLKSSNAGLKKATGDVVCLLSNDVRLYKDIVKGILDNLSGQSGGALIGGRYLDWDTGWNTFGKQAFPYLEGWLLATTKEAWNELFYFDERYVPCDFEDVDLSTTALSLGYNLVALPSDMTHHLGGQSLGFNPAREAITLANKEKSKP